MSQNDYDNGYDDARRDAANQAIYDEIGRKAVDSWDPGAGSGLVPWWVYPMAGLVTVGLYYVVDFLS